MKVINLEFDSNLELPNQTAGTLVQTEDDVVFECTVPKECVIENKSNCYLVFLLPDAVLTKRIKLPTGLNAKLNIYGSKARATIPLTNEVTRVAGAIKCSLVIKTETGKELVDEDGKTYPEIATIPSPVFYLYIKESTSIIKTVYSSEEDVVLTEIQKALDIIQRNYPTYTDVKTYVEETCIGKPYVSATAPPDDRVWLDSNDSDEDHTSGGIIINPNPPIIDPGDLEIGIDDPLLTLGTDEGQLILEDDQQVILDDDEQLLEEELLLEA